MNTGIIIVFLNCFLSHNSAFQPVLRSRLQPPLLGWSRSRFFVSRSREPEPPFLRRLWLHLFGKQKSKSLVVVTKHDFRAIYNGKCDPKKTCINNSLFKSSKLKMLVYGAGATWSLMVSRGTVTLCQYSDSCRYLCSLSVVFAISDYSNYLPSQLFGCLYSNHSSSPFQRVVTS